MKHADHTTRFALHTAKAPKDVLEIAEARLRHSATFVPGDPPRDGTFVWVCSPCSEPCTEVQPDAIHWHAPATAREVFVQTRASGPPHQAEAARVAESLRQAGLECWEEAEPEGD